VADRAYLLEVGAIKTSAPAQELLQSEELRKTYIGV
jgi:branched-chain amino acid transport system ATP-binding protein